MSCCESTFNCSAQSNATTEDCIIAYKIFDQCRKQICLTPCLLGPARCARNTASCNEILQEGDIIVPPMNAASVSIDDLCLCKILITKKKENAFRTGYWDVEVKFVFSYTITFKDSDCNFITCTRATSVYTMQVTLFGSVGSDTAMATDLVKADGLSASSGPYVSVEAKAAGLSAELRLTPKCNCDFGCDCGCGCGCDDCVTEVPTAVCVTIGLFAIIRLFRPVNMLVHSYGCCIPEDCTGAESSENVCDFFNSLSFPSDMFCPPTRNELENNCGCSNNNSNNSCSNCSGSCKR